MMRAHGTHVCVTFGRTIRVFVWLDEGGNGTEREKRASGEKGKRERGGEGGYTHSGVHALHGCNGFAHVFPAGTDQGFARARCITTTVAVSACRPHFDAPTLPLVYDRNPFYCCV